MMCRGMPSMWMCSRNTSRVVPSTAVTMAASRPARALSRLDLPALGRPAITTFIPSLRMVPCWASSRITSRSWIMSCRSFATLPSARKSISSSGKSIAASTYIRRWVTASTRASILRENTPCRERTAQRAACSELLSIRSAIASAWVRSSLSFRKARSENSPGRARRAPSSHTVLNSRSRITVPPWPWSSNTSSPVNEWGLGKYSPIPSSISSPRVSRNGP